MRKTTLLLATLVLVTFHLGCQNDESTPVRPDVNADKMPPLPECRVEGQLTQEFLAQVWSEAETTDPMNLEEAVFKVPVGAYYQDLRSTTTYADRRCKVGLTVPANAFPPPDKAGATVDITVAFPRGDLQLPPEDGCSVSITVRNEPDPIALDAPIILTVPMPAWYEVGWEMAFFFIRDHGDGATPQFTYEHLYCWEVTPGMYNVTLPAWYLDNNPPGAIPDVGGTTTWPSEPVDPDESGGDE